MIKEDITSKKLQRLIKASEGVGGELKEIMEYSLRDSKNEKDLEFIWYFNLNQFMNRVVDFRNVLAEKNGYDQINLG